MEIFVFKTSRENVSPFPGHFQKKPNHEKTLPWTI